MDDKPLTERDALLLLDSDWHKTSTRPCPTCRPISHLLGQPFGCTRVAIEERERAKARASGSLPGGKANE